MKCLFYFEDKNEYQTCITFYIAETRYQVIKMVMEEGDYPSIEDLGDFSIKKLKMFSQYIKDHAWGKVDLFQDPYWVKALYEQGGYLSYPDENIDDYYEERPPATLETALSEEVKKYDGEETFIHLPKNKK